MAEQYGASETLRGKRFVLIGFDESEAARIRVAASSVSAFAHVLTPEPAIPGLTSLAPFDVCVVNMSLKEGQEITATTDVMAMARKPTVVIGECAEIQRHASALVSLKREFIIRPWAEQELLLRAYRVLRHAEEEAASAAQRPEVAHEPVVVVADDDRTTVMLLSSILRANRMRCDVASNGAEALALARKLKPDALLLDLSMPEMDGFQVLAALKNDPATRPIPIVMLTVSHGEANIVRGFSLGADDYITKPFQPQEMISRLNRLIPQRHVV